MFALRTSRRASTALFASLAVCALGACVEPRERPVGEGQHPAGWDDPKARGFHALWLQGERKKGNEIKEIANCRKCHGEDYGGGGVGISCNSAGCHTAPKGPESCTTCHGTETSPMPETGAHAKHEAFCADCHHVPDKLEAEGHVNGRSDVVFGGPALFGGAKPTYNATVKRCQNVYCHGDANPTWEKPASPDTTCDACHSAPPDSHALFTRVATPSNCSTCHPVPSQPGIAATHIDGVAQVSEVACDTCHGQNGNPAPGPSLDGSTDPSSPRVGAHRRHLVETLPDRIGRAVPCSGCHVVPKAVRDEGHLDESAPADVRFQGGGKYDPVAQTCVVGCHFDKVPGPTWTDTSGAPLACDACHAFPPTKMRDGTTHTYAPPVLDACLSCHPWSPTTHVNGLVELLQ